MNRGQHRLMILFQADSKALEWGMGTLALVWGVVAMMSTMFHYSLYQPHMLSGAIWYVLNGIMVVGAITRIAGIVHNGSWSRARRWAGYVLFASWGTLGTYIVMSHPIGLFSLIYFNGALIELWVSMRLAIEGPDRWSG